MVFSLNLQVKLRSGKKGNRGVKESRAGLGFIPRARENSNGLHENSDKLKRAF